MGCLGPGEGSIGKPARKGEIYKMRLSESSFTHRAVTIAGTDWKLLKGFFFFFRRLVSEQSPGDATK